MADRRIGSRDVDVHLRRLFWPEFSRQGFVPAGRTGRTWSEAAVCVVNVQSLNAYLAGAIGVTTVSIAINLGVWLPHAPTGEMPMSRDRQGRPSPAEYECAFRDRVRRSDGSDTYVLRADGSDAEARVAEAACDAQDQALGWFETRLTLGQQMSLLRSDGADVGTGAPDSPQRLFLLGLTAAAAGDKAVAVQVLERYLVAAQGVPFGGLDQESTVVRTVLMNLAR